MASPSQWGRGQYQGWMDTQGRVGRAPEVRVAWPGRVPAVGGLDHFARTYANAAIHRYVPKRRKRRKG